jgi:hypothetical protein
MGDRITECRGRDQGRSGGNSAIIRVETSGVVTVQTEPREGSEWKKSRQLFPSRSRGVPEHLASSFVFSTSAEASGLRIGLFHNVRDEPNPIRMPSILLAAQVHGAGFERFGIAFANFSILAAN